MRNGAGTRPPSSSGVSGCGSRPRAVRPTVTGVGEIARDLRVAEGSGAGVAPGLAGRRDEALRSEEAGVAGAAEPAAVGPAGAGTAERTAGARVRGGPALDAGRIKTLIGKLFHVGLHRRGHLEAMRRAALVGPSVPVRQAMERDDEAVAVWKAEVWPDHKSTARDLGAYVCFEDEAGRAEAAEGPHLGAARRPPRGAGSVGAAAAGSASPGWPVPPGDQAHLCCPAAGVPAPQGRGPGVRLGRLPGA